MGIYCFPSRLDYLYMLDPKYCPTKCRKELDFIVIKTKGFWQLYLDQSTGGHWGLPPGGDGDNVPDVLELGLAHFLTLVVWEVQHITLSQFWTFPKAEQENIVENIFHFRII